jgi:polysaccharide export outer membrane protein
MNTRELTKFRVSCAAIALLAIIPAGMAQQSIADSKRVELVTGPVASGENTVLAPPALSPSPLPAGVLIGDGDLLEINVYTVYGAADVTQKTRVSNTGKVSLPFVGDVHVAGLTAEKAQDAIQTAFRDGQFMNNPHVSILIDEYATQGVSILGEVNKPSVYPLVAPRRLFDMISEAGGLTARAGRIVLITRRDTPDKPMSVNLTQQGPRSEANVDIQPGDTIVVSPAGVVYVIGNVTKPGGFTMDNNESMTVMQAIALAEGIKDPAALDRTRLIRKTPTGTQEIPLRLSKILSAKAPDVPLSAGDVLFIPNSAAKSVARRTAEAILTAATGSVIYHPPW